MRRDFATCGILPRRAQRIDGGVDRGPLALPCARSDSENSSLSTRGGERVDDGGQEISQLESWRVLCAVQTNGTAPQVLPANPTSHPIPQTHAAVNCLRSTIMNTALKSLRFFVFSLWRSRRRRSGFICGNHFIR